MAQKIIKIKKIGELQTRDIGINTNEHLYFHKNLLTHNSYSYSLLGYVQAYLKCYYPLEFWTASLNTIDRGQEKNGQSSLGKYINSIVKNGINLFSPNINKSGIEFESDESGIYFALSYIKDVSKGAEKLSAHRPYLNWEDFLTKAIKHKINKSIVKGLIFSGAVDFDDEFEDRPYKWLLYLTEKGQKKNKKGEIRWDSKVEKEFKEFEKEMPDVYDLICIEYEYCKYSFIGFKDILSETRYKNVKTISDRDEKKKLWVLIGYITEVKTKKSKKSGNEYVLITLTDFREAISVFVFWDDAKKDVLAKYKKGDLVKIAVNNETGWLKLASRKQLSNSEPIVKVEI